MAEFGLGKFFLTSRAIDALTEAGQPLEDLLKRHESGDWGEIPEEDKRKNDEALAHDNPVLSTYTLKTGVSIVVETNWNRKLTTICLPEEYRHVPTKNPG